MKTLNLIFGLLLALNSFNVFAQAKKQTRTQTNQQQAEGGGDAGGGDPTLVTASLLPGDFESSLEAAQVYLPSTLRSLELLLREGRFLPDPSAYDFAVLLKQEGIFEEVDVSAAESIILVLSNKNLWGVNVRVGNKNTINPKDPRLVELYRRVFGKRQLTAEIQPLQRELLERMFSQSQVYARLRNLTVEITNGNCLNKHGQSVTASTRASTPNAICLSAHAIVKNPMINRNNIVPTLIGLIIHELGHKVGIESERVMYAMQVPLVKQLSENHWLKFSNERNGLEPFNAPEGLFFPKIEEVLNDRKGMLNLLINNFSRFPDLEMCAQINNFAQEAMEDYQQSINERMQYLSQQSVAHYRTLVSKYFVAQASRLYCQKYFARNLSVPEPFVKINWRPLEGGGLGLKMSDIFNGLVEEAQIIRVQYMNKEDVIQNFKELKRLYDLETQALEETKAERLSELIFKVKEKP